MGRNKIMQEEKYIIFFLFYYLSVNFWFEDLYKRDLVWKIVIKFRILLRINLSMTMDKVKPNYIKNRPNSNIVILESLFHFSSNSDRLFCSRVKSICYIDKEISAIATLRDWIVIYRLVQFLKCREKWFIRQPFLCILQIRHCWFNKIRWLYRRENTWWDVGGFAWGI